MSQKRTVAILITGLIVSIALAITALILQQTASVKEVTGGRGLSGTVTNKGSLDLELTKLSKTATSSVSDEIVVIRQNEGELRTSLAGFQSGLVGDGFSSNEDGQIVLSFSNLPTTSASSIGQSSFEPTDLMAYERNGVVLSTSMPTIETGQGLTGGPIIHSGEVSLAEISGSSLLANATAALATPTAFNISRGEVVVGGDGVLTALAVGPANTVLTSDGVDLSWQASGGAGVTSLTAGTGINFPGGSPMTTSGTIELADVNAFSVKANTSNASAPPSDLVIPQGALLTNNGSTLVALSPGSASQVLTSDGTDIIWQTPASGTVTLVATGTGLTGGTITGSGTIGMADMQPNSIKCRIPTSFGEPMDLTMPRGSLLTHASPGLVALEIGTVNQVLTNDGTDVYWANQTFGTVTSVATGTGLTGGTITGSGTVGMANMPAHSLKVNATNTAASPTDITLPASSVLTNNGTNLTTLSLAEGSLMSSDGSVLNTITVGGAGTVLTSDGSVPSWQVPDYLPTGTINQMLVHNGTSFVGSNNVKADASTLYLGGGNISTVIAGNNMVILPANQTNPSVRGGQLVLSGGSSGGHVAVQGYSGNATNSGGDVSITAGSDGGSGVAGDIIITAGSTLFGGAGGNLSLTAKHGAGGGGSIVIEATNADVSDSSSDITIRTVNAQDANSGSITLSTDSVNTDQTAGSILIVAGSLIDNGSLGGVAGEVTIKAGNNATPDPGSTGASIKLEIGDGAISGKLRVRKDVTQVLTIDGQGVVLGGDGTTALPTYSFLGNPSWGMSAAPNGVNISAGSGTVIEFQSTGTVFSQAPVPASSKAILEIQSTTQGVLFPRMTTAQKNAISPVALDAGLVLYDTDLGTVNVWSGASWDGFGGATNLNQLDDCLVNLSNFAVGTIPTSLSSGVQNVIIGPINCDVLSTGSYNFVAGGLSGTTLQDGNNNTIVGIGNEVQPASNNCVVIGVGATATVDQGFFTNINVATVAPTTNTTVASYDSATGQLGPATNAASIPTGAADPVGVAAGELYFNTASLQMRAFDGTSWSNLSGTQILATASTAGVSGIPDGSVGYVPWFQMSADLLPFPIGGALGKELVFYAEGNLQLRVTLIPDNGVTMTSTGVTNPTVWRITTSPTSVITSIAITPFSSSTPLTFTSPTFSMTQRPIAVGWKGSTDPADPGFSNVAIMKFEIITV